MYLFVTGAFYDKGKRHFVLAIRSLWLHKLRAFLSVLGLPALYVVAAHEEHRGRAWLAMIGSCCALLIAAGVNVARGASFSETPRLVDVAPTVLALLGLPVAEDMDGRVLDEMFTPKWREQRPKDTVETYDTEEWRERSGPLASDVDAELTRRLKSLGYLD